MAFINITSIFGWGNKVAQESTVMEPSDKLQQSLTAQLGELQKGSPYTINAIELTDSNIYPQEDLIKRDSLISEICSKLDEHKCLILVGDILIGKTCLAESIGIAKKELNPLMLRVQYNTSLNPNLLIPVIVESGKCKLLIIDGLPEYAIEVAETLCQSINNAINKGVQILITTRNFNQLLAERFRFVQYVVPSLTVEELAFSVPQCREEGLAKLIISTSGGFPMLVNLLLYYLEINSWKLSNQQIIDFISIPDKRKVQDYVNKKIREIIKDTQDLQLLSRVALFWRPFTLDDAVAIAGVNPILATPRDRISRLLSQRLLIQVEDKLKVASFIKKIWTIDLLDEEYKECSNVIIDRIIHKHSIDILDADNAIMMLCKAKEYERAGWFYATSMTKILELKCQDSSQVSLLTMLWRDMPLPQQMSVSIRTFIRILHIQLAILTEEDSTYATDDLVHLIDELPSKNPLKAIASCYAIGKLSSDGMFQRALPLLQYAQPAIDSDLADDYLALVKEQRELSENLPLLMLASIKNLEDLMRWFDKVEEVGVSTDSINANAVKYALNKIVEVGREEEMLRTILDKVTSKPSQIVFRTVVVGRLMLYLSDHKRYSDSFSLYEDNQELLQTKLGSIIINNALACYFSDNHEENKALKCWTVVCSEEAVSICPDEVMFASTSMANVYHQKGDYSTAVCCLEAIINGSSFGTSFDEYQQMQMRGEFAIAYWYNNQKVDSFNQLLIIHNYLYAHKLETNDDYKLLELKYGICVQQYHYYLEQGTFAEEFAKPTQTLFQYPNKQFLEVYNNVRKGTNVLFLFMMASSLGVAKDTALMVAHHTIECFSELIEENNIACGLLDEMVPILLEFNDYDNAEYVVKSVLGLAPALTDAPSPIQLVTYLPLLPLCVKRVIDGLQGNFDSINRIIESHIQESLQIFQEADLSAVYDVLFNNNESCYANIKNDIAKISVRICNFEKLDVPSSINAMIIASMFFQVHKYFGCGLLRLYVYNHAKYIISKFASNFRSAYKNPLSELELVQYSQLEDLEATKKMIRLLVAFSKIEIPLTQEHEDFIGL